jgi:membrane fusion protein, multidrug efflux system
MPPRMSRLIARKHLPLTILSLGALLLALPGCKRQTAYTPPPPPHVGVAHPLQQSVTPYFETTGSTVAYNQVDLVARVEGFLQQINYQDGAFVKLGTPLFVIEPAPYQAKLQQAQASFAATQAQLVQAEAEYTRQSTLGRKDFASQSVVDQAKATLDSTRANLTSQQAGIALAGINLGYTQVSAPFDGVVTAHLASVGELVGVTGPTKLASIVQLDPIYVSFNVSEQDVLRLREARAKQGLKAARFDNVPLEIGLMTETGYPHHGAIDYIAPALDPATGTLQVRGLLQNPERALLPGLFARIRVPIAIERAEALLVPDAALGTDQGGRYLLLVDGNNVVQQRTVTTGQLVGGLRAITAGLTLNDRVVVSGLQRAVPGERVEPQDTTIAAVEKADDEPPVPAAAQGPNQTQAPSASQAPSPTQAPSTAQAPNAAPASGQAQ